MRNRITGAVSCLIDTDVIIDFLRGQIYARELLERWITRGLLAVSVIAHLELYQGMKASEEQATNDFLDGLLAIPVDVTIARSAGRLLKNLRVKGITIGMADAIVAATAIELDVPLVTNNIDHYPFSDLNLIRGLG